MKPDNLCASLLDASLAQDVGGETSALQNLGPWLGLLHPPLPESADGNPRKDKTRPGVIHKLRNTFSFLEVSSGPFLAFHVVFVPLEYIPTIPPHSTYVIVNC